MATRRSFLMGLGMGLFSASAVWADPPVGVSTSAPASDAVSVVRQYLLFHATNEWTKAYALLSRDTQGQIPFDQFVKPEPLPASSSPGGMPPLLNAITALFINTVATTGYSYQVIGIAPEDPHVVLVSVQSSSAGDNTGTQPLLIRIATSPDLRTHAPHIDALASIQKTDGATFEKMREKARQASSLSNLKQIGLAIIQYTQDHDEHYPPAAKWVDAITPYLVGGRLTPAAKARLIPSQFHDPSAPDSQKWSYAFNSNLSGLSSAQVDKLSTTVLLFESNANAKNAADTGESIPYPGRHSGGTDYAFADGHAKWISDKLTPAQRSQALSFSPAG